MLAHIHPHFLTLLRNKGNPEDPSNYKATTLYHNIVKCLDTLVTQFKHNCTFTSRSKERFSRYSLFIFSYVDTT